MSRPPINNMSPESSNWARWVERQLLENNRSLAASSSSFRNVVKNQNISSGATRNVYDVLDANLEDLWGSLEALEAMTIENAVENADLNAGVTTVDGKITISDRDPTPEDGFGGPVPYSEAYPDRGDDIPLEEEDGGDDPDVEEVEDLEVDIPPKPIGAIWEVRDSAYGEALRRFIWDGEQWNPFVIGPEFLDDEIIDAEKLTAEIRDTIEEAHEVANDTASELLAEKDRVQQALDAAFAAEGGVAGALEAVSTLGERLDGDLAEIDADILAAVQELNAEKHRVDAVRDDLAALDVQMGADLAAIGAAAVTSSVVEYALAASRTVAPSSGWSTASPVPTSAKPYVWLRTKVTYGNGDTATTSAAVTTGPAGAKGDTGADGVPGKDGVGLVSTDVEYAKSASATVAPSSGWQGKPPPPTKGQFLWTKTVWTYSDGSSETGYSTAYWAIDGASGSDGVAGKDGVGIVSTEITYAQSTSGTTAPTSGWGKNPPAAVAGRYVWTKTVWSYSDGSDETGYSVGKIGDTGATGSKGATGDRGPAGAKGDTGAQGVGIVSVIPYFRTGTSKPSLPSGAAPSGWSTNEPAYAPGLNLYRSERVALDNGAYVWTPVVEASSWGAARHVGNLESLARENMLRVQASQPTGADKGTVWWQTGKSGELKGLHYYTGSAWIPYVLVANDLIAANSVKSALIDTEDLVSDWGFIRDLMTRRLLIAPDNMVPGDPSLGVEPHAPNGGATVTVSDNPTMGPVWRIDGGDGTDGSLGSALHLKSGYMSASGYEGHFDCEPGQVLAFRARVALGGTPPSGVARDACFGVYWRDAEGTSLGSARVGLTTISTFDSAGGEEIGGQLTAPEGAVSFRLYIQKRFWSSGLLYVKSVSAMPAVGGVLIEPDGIKAPHLDVTGDMKARFAEIIELEAHKAAFTNAVIGNAFIENLVGKQAFYDRMLVSQFVVSPQNLIPGVDTIGMNTNRAGWTAFGRNTGDPSYWLQGPKTVYTDAPIPVVEGQEYLFSVEARTNVPGSRFFIQMVDFDSAASLGGVVAGSSNAGGNGAYVVTSQVAYSDFREYHSRWVSPITGRARLRIFAQHSNGAQDPTGYQWFRNPSLKPAVGNVLIENDAITAGKIATDAVTTNHIKANAVTTGKIAADAVTAREIKAKSISANEIAADTIVAGSAIIMDQAIGSAMIGNLQVTNSHIKDLSAEKINAGYISASRIQASSIAGTKLAANAIDGKTITGATIQTVSTANRGVKITSSGIQAWDSSGNLTVDITGDATTNRLVGQLHTGAPGKPGIIMPQTTTAGKFPAIWFSSNGSTSSNEAAIYPTDNYELVIRNRSGGGPVEIHPGAWAQTSFTAGGNNPYEYSQVMDSNGAEFSNIGPYGGLWLNNAPTSGSSANAIIAVSPAGRFYRTTSVRAAKLDIEPIEKRQNPYNILKLPVVDWINRVAVEERADALEREMLIREGVDIEPSPFSSKPALTRVPGVIAEDVAEAGLSEFVDKDENGDLSGVLYDRLPLLMIPIVKDLLKRIDVLEERLENVGR